MFLHRSPHSATGELHDFLFAEFAEALSLSLMELVGDSLHPSLWRSNDVTGVGSDGRSRADSTVATGSSDAF